MAETVSVDYLVVGAGAMGMAFVDELLTHTKATVAIVDKYHAPGGHWTTAYPFVRLHQPSSFYGVNSRRLGEDKIDQVGLNGGLYELATSFSVLDYYIQILVQEFLPSGRVSYFPKSEYTADGQWRSLVTGKTYQVGKATKIVDSTFMKVTVPSMVPPPYKVASDVELVTPNALPKITRPYAKYTVVGAGKTGIDAVLYLLSLGVDTSQIVWIMPRDSWLMPREGCQPKEIIPGRTIKEMVAKTEAIMLGTDVDDVLKRVEEAGILWRISDKVWPTMFRCATVSYPELEQIRKIEGIIRKGRVLEIRSDEIIFEGGGSYTPDPDTLYVDCTADGLAKRTPVPVFRGNLITLQSVRPCQQVFSAAFIAHIETTYSGDDEARKNSLCRVVPHPNYANDWFVTQYLADVATERWSVEPKTLDWLQSARLDLVNGPTGLAPLAKDPAERAAQLQERVERSKPVCEKLVALLKSLPGKEGDIVRSQVPESLV